MPYEEEKKCFVDHVQQKQNWSHKSFEELRGVLGTTPIYKQFEHTLAKHNIHGLLWEGCLVDGKYVIVYSQGDTIVILSQQQDGELIAQEKLNFPINILKISNVLGVVQIFVGSSTGTLKHLYFEFENNRLTSTFQTMVNTDVFAVVPCSFHSLSHRPSYFWTVGKDAIKFNASIDSIIHPSVVYTVPVQARFISAQDIYDDRDFSKGIACHYISESGNELYTIIIDATPAMIYTEKSFRYANNKKVFHVQNIRYTISPVRSQSGMISNLMRRQQADSICSVITSQAIHDYEIDFGNIEASLQNSQSNFTWIAHTLHSNGVINKIQFYTKQHELRKGLEMYGERLISSKASSEDFASLQVVYNDKHEVNSFFPHSTSGFESKTATHAQPNDSVSIFSAILDCRLCLVSRKSIVFESMNKNDEFYRRVIILEALVALRLSETIGKAIEKKDCSTFNERYFVDDVQRIFDWVAGSASANNSLFRHTVNNWKSVLENKSVPLLCNRSYSSNIEENSSMEVLMMHGELVTAALALQTIIIALFRRKSAIIDQSFVHNYSNIMQITLTYDLVLQSLVELFLLMKESEVLLKTVQFHRHMVHDVAFTLSIFNESGAITNRMHTIARETVQGRKCVDENMKGVLPQYLLSENLFFDLYANQLPQKFHTKLNFYEWDISMISEKASDLLMLPYMVVHERCAILTAQKLYIKKTLHQLADELTDNYAKACRLVLYVFLDCNTTSNDLLRSSLDEMILDQVQLNVPTISNILGMDRETMEYVHAAQCIDSATRLDVAIAKFSFSTGINYLEMNEFILPLIQRLLTSGHQAHASKFIHALAVRDHPILSTKEGSVAVAIAQSPDRDWKSTWELAKKNIGNIRAAEHALQASLDVTRFITIWTIRHGVLPDLLSCSLDLGEIESVIASLQELVEQDLNDRRSPSPSIDTVFAFLLKNFRIEDARKLHEDHIKAIDGKIDVTRDDSILDREALLRGFSRIVLPSRLDYEMRLNLSRTKAAYSK